MPDKFKDDLSKEQLDMLEKNKENIDALREAFIETLTDEQKARMQERAKNRLKKSKRSLRNGRA